MEMSTEYDKPGFRYPPIARGYGFMGDVNTMQELPTCIPTCPTFTSGIGHGAGLAIGVGVVAGVAVGLIALFRKR